MEKRGQKTDELGQAQVSFFEWKKKQSPGAIFQSISSSVLEYDLSLFWS